MNHYHYFGVPRYYVTAGFLVGMGCGYLLGEHFHPQSQFPFLKSKRNSGLTNTGGKSEAVEAQALTEAVAVQTQVQARPGSASRRPIDSHFIADATKKASPAVVAIRIQALAHVFGFPLEASSYGSGFIIDSQGIILTNAHVVSDVQPHVHMEGITVVLADGRVYKAEVVAADELSDIAVLKIVPKDKQKEPLVFPTVELGVSNNLCPGEWVVAIGTPLTLKNSVSCGIISNVERQDVELGIGNRMSYIQTTAPITFGNSGGPLVNLDGQVVGITTMTSPGTSLGFAIPIDKAKEIADQLRQHGRVDRTYIGISMLPLTPENLEELRSRGFDIKLPDGVTGGLLVVDVLPHSPAAKAGLRPKTVIIEVDGTPARNTEDITKRVTSPGRRLRFKTVDKRSRMEEKEIVVESLPSEKTKLFFQRSPM